MAKSNSTVAQKSRSKNVNARLAACYGLLARAAMDLGPKAVGSSKISRALEDMCAVRDALAEISGMDQLMKQRPSRQAVAGSISGTIADGDEAAVRQIIFQSAEAYKKNWAYHVERETKRRKGGDSHA